MNERPILFSGPMVRAILAGTKTQTRRVVLQAQPPDTFQASAVLGMFRCPYGAPGDRLWVREAFRQGYGNADAHYRADEDECAGGPWRPSIHMPRYLSRLTLEVTEVRVQRLHEISEEDVRAEGVMLPVTPNGHPAICVSASPRPSEFLPGKLGKDWTLADCWRHAYAILWDSLNRKRAPWSSNPWVWAITFKRLA